MNPTIRSQFATTETYAYLNSAAVAPPPKAAIDAVLFQLEDAAVYAGLRFGAWVDTKKRCRSLMAQILGCRDEQLAFIRNTSDGFASIANGLEWKAGQNIVSFADEFPANFYAWRNVRDRHGVELRLAPERDGRIDLDELISLIDADTRLVAISSVQFSSGFRSDLARIAEAARKAGLTVVTWDSPIPSAQGEQLFVAQVDFNETGAAPAKKKTRRTRRSSGGTATKAAKPAAEASVAPEAVAPEATKAAKAEAPAVTPETASDASAQAPGTRANRIASRISAKTMRE